MKTTFNTSKETWKLISMLFFFFRNPEFGSSVPAELISIQLAIPPNLLDFLPLLKKPQAYKFQIIKFTIVALYKGTTEES